MGRRLRRGEIWTSATRGRYTSKPRPVVIVQDDRFDATKSITVCALTSNPLEAPLLRIVVEANDTNGLRQTSRLMVDKISTLPKTNLRDRIGRLSDEDMMKLNRAIVVFLGIGS